MGEEFEFIAQIFGLIPPPDSPVSVEVTQSVSLVGEVLVLVN